MTDRPSYCCGACPAVEPNPEHPDCEACRTGYDCTCRDNPRCPNYQETKEGTLCPDCETEGTCPTYTSPGVGLYQTIPPTWNQETTE